MAKTMRPVSYFAASLMVAALLAHQLHVPLPAKWTERNKMTFVDVLLRLIYFYPMRYLSLLGSNAPMKWTRFIMNFNAHMMSPWSMNDADLNIADTTMAGIPVRTYNPKHARANDGAIIFIHGGGFVIGDVVGYDGMTREIARHARMFTISIEYRLAPEHIFPAGLEDCLKVVTSFLAHDHRFYNVDPTKVVVVGDSAGGNLATVVAQRLRSRRDLPQLKGQVLLYPLLQLHDLHLPSYQEYHAHYSRTSFLDPEQVVRGMLLYLGIDAKLANVHTILANGHMGPALRDLAHFMDHDLLPQDFRSNGYSGAHVAAELAELYHKMAPFLFNPDFSPLMQTNLTGMPASLVCTCEFDILRDEGFLYANKLRGHGVQVEWKHYEGGFHAMLNLHHELALATQMLRDVSRFARELMDTSTMLV